MNWIRLPLLCEKFGAILLVLVDLTAGSQTKYLKIFTTADQIVRIYIELMKGQCSYSVTNAFQSVKFIVRRVLKEYKILMPWYCCT